MKNGDTISFTDLTRLRHPRTNVKERLEEYAETAMEVDKNIGRYSIKEFLSS